LLYPLLYRVCPTANLPDCGVFNLALVTSTSFTESLQGL
jgi:hypothetical protein